MAILIVSDDRRDWDAGWVEVRGKQRHWSWTILDDIFPERTIYVAGDMRHALNYLVDTSTIEAVFMGFELWDGKKFADKKDKKRGVITSRREYVDGVIMVPSLIDEFIGAGFGYRGKPLVACDREHNQELIKAGCSHITDWSPRSLGFIADEIRARRYMSRTV